jgi:two-component system CheB/CheR fusion protein
LAEDQRGNAVCIVLSGNGTDGTLGLRAIKAESGMAIVQEPGTAAFTGMPDSALATGLADYVLPPAQMPEQLLEYARSPHLAHRDGEPDQPFEQALRSVVCQCTRVRWSVNGVFQSPRSQ